MSAKTETIRVRVTAEQKAAFRRAAGNNVSAWLVSLAEAEISGEGHEAGGTGAAVPEPSVAKPRRTPSPGSKRSYTPDPK